MVNIMDSSPYSRVSIEKPFGVEVEHSDDETVSVSGGPQDGLLSGLPKAPLPRFWTRAFWMRSSGDKPSTHRRGLLKLGFWATSALMLLGSYLGIFFIGRHSFGDKELDKMCMYRTSPWSPILDFMDPTPKLTQFNGTLGFPSQFTGDPSPELDAVWEKWGYVKYASIPEEEFFQLPGAKDHFQDAARLTPEYGGGYIGFLEFSHHMHCLNMLRQGIHQDYYNNPDHPEHRAEVFSDAPHTVKVHMQHCIEIIRQNIMCNADVGIIPHQWITSTPDPYANFNTFHKCRDINAVEKWIKEHEIPDTPDGSDLPIPLDSKIFAKPP